MANRNIRSEYNGAIDKQIENQQLHFMNEYLIAFSLMDIRHTNVYNVKCMDGQQ